MKIIMEPIEDDYVCDRCNKKAKIKLVQSYDYSTHVMEKLCSTHAVCFAFNSLNNKEKENG